MHHANDSDHDDPATALITDRDLDDLAERIIAWEDARDAFRRARVPRPMPQAPRSRVA